MYNMIQTFLFQCKSNCTSSFPPEYSHGTQVLSLLSLWAGLNIHYVQGSSGKEEEEERKMMVLVLSSRNTDGNL